jgi:hypothetical protein
MTEHLVRIKANRRDSPHTELVSLHVPSRIPPKWRTEGNADAVVRSGAAVDR